MDKGLEYSFCANYANGARDVKGDYRFTSRNSFSDRHPNGSRSLLDDVHDPVKLALAQSLASRACFKSATDAACSDEKCLPTSSLDNSVHQGKDLSFFFENSTCLLNAASFSRTDTVSVPSPLTSSSSSCYIRPSSDGYTKYNKELLQVEPPSFLQEQRQRGTHVDSLSEGVPPHLIPHDFPMKGNHVQPDTSVLDETQFENEAKKMVHVKRRRGRPKGCKNRKQEAGFIQRAGSLVGANTALCMRKKRTSLQQIKDRQRCMNVVDISRESSVENPYVSPSFYSSVDNTSLFPSANYNPTAAEGLYPMDMTSVNPSLGSKPSSMMQQPTSPLFLHASLPQTPILTSPKTDSTFYTHLSEQEKKHNGPLGGIPSQSVELYDQSIKVANALTPIVPTSHSHFTCHHPLKYGNFCISKIDPCVLCGQSGLTKATASICSRKTCNRVFCFACLSISKARPGLSIFNNELNECVVCVYQSQKRANGDPNNWHFEFKDLSDAYFIRTLRDVLPLADGLFIEISKTRQPCWRRKLDNKARKHFSFRFYGGVFESRLEALEGCRQPTALPSPVAGPPSPRRATNTASVPDTPLLSNGDMYPVMLIRPYSEAVPRFPWGAQTMERMMNNDPGLVENGATLLEKDNGVPSTVHELLPLASPTLPRANSTSTSDEFFNQCVTNEQDQLSPYFTYANVPQANFYLFNNSQKIYETKPSQVPEYNLPQLTSLETPHPAECRTTNGTNPNIFYEYAYGGAGRQNPVLNEQCVADYQATLPVNLGTRDFPHNRPRCETNGYVTAPPMKQMKRITCTPSYFLSCKH